MKKLIIILALGLTLTSCSNTPTKVENPKEETTVELQQLASIDTTTYKVVEKDNIVYVLSVKDNMVVKKVNNDNSGLTKSLFLLFLIVLVFFWLMIVFND